MKYQPTASLLGGLWCLSTIEAWNPTTTTITVGSRWSRTDPSRDRTRLAASTLEDLDKGTVTDRKPKKSSSSPPSFRDQLANSGLGSAALLATAAVNQAVSMKALDAPSVDKTYIALTRPTSEVDEEGLPLVYDKELIQQYWSNQKGALNQRWSYFVGKAVPFFTKLITLWIRDGQIKPEELPALSRQARMDLQDLGPTFIKVGQMMSVRPDVLPESTLQELAMLQDSVVPFDTAVAIQQIERELKGPLGQFFTSISEEPVAGTYYVTLVGDHVVWMMFKPPHSLCTPSVFHILQLYSRILGSSLSGDPQRWEGYQSSRQGTTAQCLGNCQ
jgi:hypothetical protein